MKRLQRVLGRRDTKVFLLLWAPVIWVWGLCLAAGWGDYRELVFELAESLAKILAMGLLLLGTASGVDRYHALRRPEARPRLHWEIWAMIRSALMGVLLITFGVVHLWAVAWDVTQAWPILVNANLFSEFYAPFSVLLYAPRGGAGPISLWMVCPWPGWILGYIIGRRWGKFLPSLAITAAVTPGIAWLLYQLSGVNFGEYWQRVAWMDAGALLTLCAAVGFLCREGLRKRGRPRMGMAFQIAFMLGFVPLFFGYGAYLHRLISPSSPPALKIVGLDPETGQLLVQCGNDYGGGLYGVELSEAESADGKPGTQFLYRFDPSFYLYTAFHYYVPSAGALALLRMEDQEFQLVWKRPGHTDILKTGMPGFLYAWRRFSSPFPTWYARFPYEEGSNSDTIRDAEGRLSGLRILLYCPATGERKHLVGRSKTGRAITQFTWPRKDLYSGRPGAPLPERVPVEVEDPSQGDDIIGLCCDGFLFADRSEMQGKQVYAVLNRPREGWGTILELEVSNPPSTYDYRKIPSPAGNRGCVWEVGKRKLTILENGRPIAPVLADANPDFIPLWSPDGEYLLYASHPANATQSVLSLAFPERVGLFPSAFRYFWSVRSEWLKIFWSVHSDWVTFVTNLESPEATILIFRPPEFENEAVRILTRDYKDAQTLHDGSFVFVDDGKVFQWRPEWDGPRCIYDPERKTILENSEFRITD